MLEKWTRVSATLLWFGLVGCGDPGAALQDATPSVPVSVGNSPQSEVKSSTDGRKCLELVEQQEYAQAIGPCERAADETANADVGAAYAKASDAVAKIAQKAAADAARGLASDETK
jgi:hypothetical protein